MGTPTTRMTVSDIAELAGVQRATVSNWQRRHEEFPKPLPDSAPGRPQFDATAVRAWLTNRYPEKVASTSRTADLVRNWRYTVNHVQCDDATDPITLLIAAVEGEHITYWEGNDERYPVGISVRDLDTTIFATRSQADAIRHFLEVELKLNGVERTELIEVAAQEFDDLGRWRRNPDAIAAEQNLHNLLAGLVHEESKTVLDFACGTGALLAATTKHVPKANLHGMEPDLIASFIADARTVADIQEVDILEVDALAGRTFDAVVSIPPFGRRVDTIKNERMHRLPFGPVRGSADAAWPQLAVQALTPEGEAFLVLPHSVSIDDRVDNVRRELIRQGVLAAVVTLPANAHPSSKVLSDLWVLTRRRERGAAVLMVDYSLVDPADATAFVTLRRELSDWLDGGPSPTSDDGEFHFYMVDASYVDVVPIELLGPTVILDPQYWCARAGTPTSADELISVVYEKTAALADSSVAVIGAEAPDPNLSPDRLPMITVRDARDRELLEIIRRTTASKELPTLKVADAEAMRRGDYAETDASEHVHGGQLPASAVREGDVLVWASSDRQIRAVKCTTSGVVPSSMITVLRCGPELDPDYVALAIAAGVNAVHATGSTIPTLRSLDLTLPLVSTHRQREIADLVRTARELAQAARRIVNAADAFEQALADAVGSGAVAIDMDTGDR